MDKAGKIHLGSCLVDLLSSMEWLKEALDLDADCYDTQDNQKELGRSRVL